MNHPAIPPEPPSNIGQQEQAVLPIAVDANTIAMEPQSMVVPEAANSPVFTSARRVANLQSSELLRSTSQLMPSKLPEPAPNLLGSGRDTVRSPSLVHHIEATETALSEKPTPDLDSQAEEVIDTAPLPLTKHSHESSKLNNSQLDSIEKPEVMIPEETVSGQDTIISQTENTPSDSLHGNSSAENGFLNEFPTTQQQVPENSFLDEFPATQQRIPENSPLEDFPSIQQQVYIETIEIKDGSIFSDQDFAPILQIYQGQTLTIDAIKDLRNAITQLYLNAGYITSRAFIDNYDQDSGVLSIRLVEGGITEFDIQGTQRLNPSYIRQRLELGAGPPLNTAELEEQLKLLRADPLLDNIEASLQPSGQIGESILLVRATEAKSFTGDFSLDNYSPPSVGSERLGTALRYRNLTGIGDSLSASYYRTTTGGVDALDVSYQVPLTPMNGTLKITAAPSRNEITQTDLAQLGIRGNTERYGVSYRHPLIRTTQEELALSLGFTYQEGQTFLFDQLPTPFGIGPDQNGVSRTSVLQIGQDYIKRDSKGAWALNSQFNIGTHLFHATTNEGNTPDGQFISWTGQVQRVQQLHPDHLLLIQAAIQLTPDSLLPAHQFVIGGGQSVRGYRQNARSGDNGVRFLVEDRITIHRNEAGLPDIQLAPFVNAGAVWNHPHNPNQLSDQTALVAIGSGILLTQLGGLEGLNARIDYSVPLVRLRDRGNNAQDAGFNFSISYQL